MNVPRGSIVVLVLSSLLTIVNPVVTSADGSAPVATTPHFAFYSDFDTNLNDALIAAGAARNDGKPELFQSGERAKECFEELPASARAGWDLAVDYYARVIAPARWLDRQQYLLRADLAGFGDLSDTRTQRFLQVGRGFRTAAAVAYESCRWSHQDAENRRWIEAVLPRLAAHESNITARLERLYRTPWHDLPIRVDLVSAALPVGANTISRPPHIMISSSVADRDALEIVHHEASHTLMDRGDPMQQALAEAARKLDVRLPNDLWHVLLFYTTGEAVREALEEAGEPDYVPYMYFHDLWKGRWGRYREAIEKTWPAYLSGQRDLSDAAVDLVRAVSAGDD
jgi:hypothetical protein